MPDVLAQLPSDVPRFTKPTFGLADVREILAGVAATGRGTAVLVGAVLYVITVTGRERQ